MKDEALYLKIEQQRRNKKFRWARPFYNFHIKTYRSRKLLRKIESSIKNKKTQKTILNEALFQYVISDITAFEVYFKDIFLAIFDFRNDSKELLIKCYKNKLIKEKFDFEDLVKIEYENYTLSEIILQFQNFQNLQNINDVFSAIVDKDFFGHLTNREYNPNTEINFKLDEDWNPKLKKYLELRHNLVHDYNPKLRLNRQEIENLHWNLVLFIVAADICLDSEFIDENLKDEFKKK